MLPFPFIIDNGLSDGLWFIIGGIVFDLDHLVYFSLTTKPLNIKNIKKRMLKDFIESNPHFYVFHTIEFIFLSLILNFFFQFKILIIISIGWLVHMAVDTIDYIIHYKSYKPWLFYFSFITYYTFVKTNQN
jgi:hypothetical protein